MLVFLRGTCVSFLRPFKDLFLPGQATGALIRPLRPLWLQLSSGNLLHSLQLLEFLSLEGCPPRWGLLRWLNLATLCAPDPRELMYLVTRYLEHELLYHYLHSFLSSYIRHRVEDQQVNRRPKRNERVVSGFFRFHKSPPVILTWVLSLACCVYMYVFRGKCRTGKAKHNPLSWSPQYYLSYCLLHK